MDDITPEEAQVIARDAYIYGFPIVENYKTLYAYAVAEGTPNYKAPFNEISNVARVFTPEDTAIVTPNSDTPYSFVTLDLRAEPVVLTIAPSARGATSVGRPSISTPTWRRTSAAAPRGTAADGSCSPGRAGRARRRKESPWCYGCRPNSG